jgi:ABC-2 type transport system permease protein
VAIDVWRSPIRSSAFLAKEITVILRQPRLILTLALGPFLILLLFGLGFRNTGRVFRTLFVAPTSGPLAQQVESFGTSLGPQLVFSGVVDNETAASARLRQGDVDLVIVVPADAITSIRNSQQSVLTIYHNELDPLQAGYIDYSSQIYTSEVNRRIVESIVAAVQKQAGDAQGQLAAAQMSAQAVQTALHAGDVTGARQHQNELVQNLSAVQLGVGAGIGLLGGVEQGLGQSGTGGQSASLLALLNSIHQGTNALDNIPDNPGSNSMQEQTAGDVATELAQLKASLAQFTGIQPGVLVSPFRAETKSVAGSAITVTNYYAPAVLALLLQHLAVTFGALSMVGERRTGTVELFRVSPASPGEVLIGKYGSCLLFGGFVAAILTLLLRFVLGVPMVGSWVNFAGVVLLVLFASLSIGFVISLAAQSESQAVQFGMLVLLASVLFSGFFTALYLFAPPVRAIAYLLPVTYGIQLLQSVMLRGAVPNITLLAGLLLIGLVLFIVAWLQTARLMARR